MRIVDGARLALIERLSNARIMPATFTRSVEAPAVFVPGEETRKSLRAMRRAYARVVLENNAWGLPVIQWREGRGVVHVPPQQFEPLARRILEVDGDPLPEAEEQELLQHLTV